MNNRASYNRIAKQWSDSRKDSFVSRLVEDFADRIKPNGAILDIGCGSGIPLTQYLSGRGFSVTGIDISEEMIALAKSHSIGKASFTVCDFLAFTTNNRLNAVLAWDSLSHLPKDEQKMIYPKISSLLQPGGYFLFTHGCTDGEHVDTMMGESFYYSSISEHDIYEQLKDNGFKIEYAHHDFVEDDEHRAFIALARKM